MISKTSLQVIKALLELAELPKGKSEGVVRIAKRIRAPENYLGKVLQRFVHDGVVISQKGLYGGFRLAKTPAEIRLYDVVGSLEDLNNGKVVLWAKPFVLKQALVAHIINGPRPGKPI